MCKIERHVGLAHGGALVFAGIIYLLLPILLFFFGFLKIWLSIPLAALFIVFGVRLFLRLQKQTSDAFALPADGRTSRKGFFKKARHMLHTPLAFVLLAFFALAIWVILSGIGSFSYQNSDFFARNAIYRDLIDYRWPVYFDLATEPAAVQTVTGNGVVALSYYFAWWLPPAALSKLFHFGEVGRELAIYFWAFLGVLLIFACLTKLFRRRTYSALMLFVLFGGLDILCFYHAYGFFRFTEHMEWWAEYFQYSAQTTQLFWAFNQSIPLWLIMSLFLLSSDNENTAALLSLAFAYSPWATIGLVPYALVATLQKKKWKQAINPVNILVPLAMLFVFGSFYLASSGSAGGMGLIFDLYPAVSATKILVRYLVFILLEIGVYYLCAGPELLKLPYHKTTLVLLLVLPLVYIRDFNFTMRGSVPALFILMVGCVCALHRIPKRQRIRKAIFIVLLVIGFGTSLSEIGRSLVKRAELPKESWREESVMSLGNMRTDDPWKINLLQEQFFVKEPAETFFFSKLAK